MRTLPATRHLTGQTWPLHPPLCRIGCSICAALLAPGKRKISKRYVSSILVPPCSTRLDCWWCTPCTSSGPPPHNQTWPSEQNVYDSKKRVNVDCVTGLFQMSSNYFFYLEAIFDASRTLPPQLRVLFTLLHIPHNCSLTSERNGETKNQINQIGLHWSKHKDLPCPY